MLKGIIQSAIESAIQSAKNAAIDAVVDVGVSAVKGLIAPPLAPKAPKPPWNVLGKVLVPPPPPPAKAGGGGGSSSSTKGKTGASGSAGTGGKSGQKAPSSTSGKEPTHASASGDDAAVDSSNADGPMCKDEPVADGSMCAPEEPNTAIEQARQEAIEQCDTAIERLEDAKRSCDPDVNAYFKLDPNDPEYEAKLDDLLERYRRARAVMPTMPMAYDPNFVGYGQTPATNEWLDLHDIEKVETTPFVGTKFMADDRSGRGETFHHEAHHYENKAGERGYHASGKPDDVRHPVRWSQQIELDADERADNADTYSEFAQHVRGQKGAGHKS